IENNATGTDTQTACESYTWIDGNTYTSDNNTATHTISGGAANGCDSIVTLDLTIENNATGTDTQTACESYTWIDGNTYTSDNNTATHIISGGAANGCDSIVTLDLTVTSGGPSINIENVQNVSCANGDDGSAEAVVSGGASPYTYDWSPTGGTGATANNLSAGTYTVEVTDDAGCVGTENVTITAPDPINALASVTDANCGESNGSISLTTNGGTPSYSYSWSPGEDTNATLTNVPPGSYAVSITDDLGCTLDTVFNVALTGDFLIEALPKESTIQDGGTVGLSVNIDDNVDGENYTWTPPDGLSCTDCSSPDASPSSSTTYYVTVETTDGCSSTDSIHITIDDDCNELFIPNMFSPNGDGENDEFCIYGNCINSYQLSIYNRWGELIFNADDQNNCWDGTYNGKMMNTGVFAYKLFVTTEQGEEIEKSGNINLTR
ncbi:MAG: gliding motility-associated C-terminal domain-containing protein, partial [Brumimicrobium sp.]